MERFHLRGGGRGEEDQKPSPPSKDALAATIDVLTAPSSGREQREEEKTRYLSKYGRYTPLEIASLKIEKQPTKDVRSTNIDDSLQSVIHTIVTQHISGSTEKPRERDAGKRQDSHDREERYVSGKSHSTLSLPLSSSSSSSRVEVVEEERKPGQVVDARVVAKKEGSLWREEKRRLERGQKSTTREDRKYETEGRKRTRSPIRSRSPLPCPISTSADSIKKHRQMLPPPPPPLKSKGKTSDDDDDDKKRGKRVDTRNDREERKRSDTELKSDRPAGAGVILTDDPRSPSRVSSTDPTADALRQLLTLGPRELLRLSEVDRQHVLEIQAKYNVAQRHSGVENKGSTHRDGHESTSFMHSKNRVANRSA